MEIAYTAEQEGLRSELRNYYDALLDPETVAALSAGHGVGPVTRRVWKQMCADGWAGIGWPTAWGGQGRSAIEQFIFFDESMRAGAPVPMLTINTVGPTIMNFGSDEQTLVLPSEDPRRRHPLLHRLLRARGRHRSRRAPDAGRPRRRRVRHQRPEDVDVALLRRRLLLAGRAHRSRGQEAQGDLDRDRADGHRRASRSRRSA